MSPTWKINICMVSGFYLTAGNHFSVEMYYPINITYLFLVAFVLSTTSLNSTISALPFCMGLCIIKLVTGHP